MRQPGPAGMTTRPRLASRPSTRRRSQSRSPIRRTASPSGSTCTTAPSCAPAPGSGRLPPPLAVLLLASHHRGRPTPEPQRDRARHPARLGDLPRPRVRAQSRGIALRAAASCRPPRPAHPLRPQLRRAQLSAARGLQPRAPRYAVDAAARSYLSSETAVLDGGATARVPRLLLWYLGDVGGRAASSASWAGSRYRARLRPASPSARTTGRSPSNRIPRASRGPRARAAPCPTPCPTRSDRSQGRDDGIQVALASEAPGRRRRRLRFPGRPATSRGTPAGCMLIRFVTYSGGSREGPPRWTRSCRVPVMV